MHKILLTLFFVFALIPAPAYAWMGFDADTSELVEVTPDQDVPGRGDTIVVHDIAQNANISCLVRDVQRNAQTIELTVTTSDGENRILVMEGK